MKYKGSHNLAKDFATARDRNLQAARENFEYVYKNGGYTLDDLAIIFRHAMPIMKWEKSMVRKFINPENAVDPKYKVSLQSAAAHHITSFLKASISLRDTVQTELAKAEQMMIEAHARWGEMADAPPTRAPILKAIRENLAYIHENGGYTFEKCAAILKGACPDHAWDKGSARLFIYPEKACEGRSSLTLSQVTSENMLHLLSVSIDLKNNIMTAKERELAALHLISESHKPPFVG